jgi:UDPglucose 6-dehydrogenase
MKIGFIGIGKLGLPVCIGIDAKGHDVLGYDINPKVNEDVNANDLLLSKEVTPDGKYELKSSDMIKKSKCKFTNSLSKCIQHSEILFCAVQTPHNKEYEGDIKMPETRKDFNYDYLISSIKSISEETEKLNKETILVIISTVLPGTIRKYIFPVLSPKIKLCYNPYFIAMGTVLPDFYFPEFILLGVVHEDAKEKIIEFYSTITSSPVYPTTLENAEMIKVTYNTFITAKICLANTVMLMCDNLPNTNCDDIMKGLFLADKRIISKNYLTGGMGDGGGCHPRDNIALSWLSNEIGLEFNFYDFIMKCRESQTEYLVTLIQKYKKNYDYPIYLLGKSFKPETDICTGSPAILLKNIIDEKKIEIKSHYDPYIDKEELIMEKGIFCFTTKHKVFADYKFPEGSIVIDPFRIFKNKDNIIYHGVGCNY